MWCSLLSRIFRWEKKKEEEITLKFQFICFLSRAGRNRVRFLLIIHNYIRNLRLQRENQKKKYLSISRERKKLRREERKRKHFHCINRISHEIFPHQKKTIDEFFVLKKRRRKKILSSFFRDFLLFCRNAHVNFAREDAREEKAFSLSLLFLGLGESKNRILSRKSRTQRGVWRREETWRRRRRRREEEMHLQNERMSRRDIYLLFWQAARRERERRRRERERRRESVTTPE